MNVGKCALKPGDSANVPGIDMSLYSCANDMERREENCKQQFREVKLQDIISIKFHMNSISPLFR